MVNDGEMEMFVDGKKDTLKKGEFSVALSFAPHSYKTPYTSRSSIIFIPPQICEAFVALTENKRLASPFIKNEAAYNKIRECFNHLKNDNISEITRLGYVYIILGVILENSVLEEVKNPTDTELISKILFYINENFNEDISPSSVSEHFGYSQSYISRYFKACCGINLLRYINLMRLRNAIMLMNKGNNITFCILESGFSSATTFYRTFKKEYGCSPKEYAEKTIK
jgi:AraC-like DNA-binding protein